MTVPVDLFSLAGGLGVHAGYWDTRGTHHDTSADTTMALLRAMGMDITSPDDLDGLRAHIDRRRKRALEPVTVAWGEGPLSIAVTLDASLGDAPVRVELIHEDATRRAWVLDADGAGVVDSFELDGRRFVVRRVELAGPHLVGCHRSLVEVGSERFEATVLVAPQTLVAPPAEARMWGVFAPLYSLVAADGTGPGVAQLASLADGIHGLGGSVVATLPLLATYLDRPYDPSPYTPVSRMFWNELYVDLTDVGRDAAGVSGDFDYRSRARFVDGRISAMAAASFDAADPDRTGFDAFVAGRPEVVEYARFRATAEHHATGWHAWPTRQRAGRLSPGDYDPARVRHHMFAQYLMDRSMRDLGNRLSERDQVLYLDLPIGSHGDGYDTWCHRDRFAWGVGTGAPPDDFFEGGQNWGFPPLSPEGDRESGYGFVRACLRHHMEVAKLVRLDHVMQLERLWWIPDGADAREGAYVSYPRDELLALVAIESHRHGCVVVGEDLGTVSDEIHEAMSRRAMLGMHVAQFQMPSWAGAQPGEPPHRSVAAFGTHDTATFAGFVAAHDIDIREQTGRLDADQASRARAQRAQQVENFRGFLAARGFCDRQGDDHDLLRGLLAYLGESDAAVVLVALEDLWGETNPQNLPGTDLTRPNWVQRFPMALDDLFADERIRADLWLLECHRAAASQRAAGSQP